MCGEDSARRARLSCFLDALDAEGYQDILQNSLLPAAQGWFEDEKQEWEIFQQDKASCHTAKSTKRWLEQHGVGVVEDWPTKGDDINPMRTFGPSLMTDWSTKSLQQRKE